MSLRARLLGLVLLATLLPALLLGWRFFRESDAEVASAVSRLASVADNIAGDLEHRVQGTAQLNFGIAHSQVLDGADRLACSLYLSQVREAYPQYTGIVSVLPDGQLFCDSLQSGRVLNLADRAYFKRVLAGATGVTLEPVFGRITGNSVLQIVYPARTGAGVLRFMLVASLNLQRFAQEAQQRALLPATEVLLVDDKGMVMAWVGGNSVAARPKAGDSIAGAALFALARDKAAEGGTGELLDAAGRAQVWAVAGSPAVRAAGLNLLLGLPKQALVADSKLHLRQGLTVLAAAALLLFTGVWLLAEWGIRRQVGRITAMVRELGAGHLGARIALPYPRGELGGLMAVLNSTAASLQRQREAIDELGLRLRQAQKLEALGTLVGGIAHDFNNIIGAILGNLSLAHDDVLAGRSPQHGLAQIRQAALRARDLVQRISAFSRSDTPALTEQPLRPIVEEVLALVRVAMPAGASLQTELETPPGPVAADATQLHQVLMNLCSNAWQALQGGQGQVTVALTTELLGSDEARRPAGLSAGLHAVIRVSDSGCGIDAATRERIFEPYFTTKGPRGGTGLGLSVVHGIVNAHHGSITVHSEPGRGSSFSVYLPLRPLNEGSSTGAAEPVLPRGATGGGQRVLYIDDDEVMATMVERLLVAAGYRASCHLGALAALAMLRAEPTAWDLVVTDFNMPELSGLEVGRRVAELRADLPVIIISGYIPDELPAQARQAGVRAVIRKQHVLEELIPAIGSALATAAERD